MSGKLLYATKFVWLTTALLALTNLVGLLIYGSPLRRNRKLIRKYKRNGWPEKKLLVLTYVSRGDNKEALLRAIKESLKVLDDNDVNFVIEVVTDQPVAKITSLSSKIFFHIVPKEYQTKKKAKYKARALHYLTESRDFEERLWGKNEKAWILHLDEESMITNSCVAGIAEFVSHSENEHAVGQGEIKYNAYNYGNNLAITAIDSVRTGDDLGRFRLQYKLFKKPLFGMHGSYFLVPYRIEQNYGFDLGGKGSITEDAYFALHAMEDSTKFKWVDGHIAEQSPFSISAILKQRRRWYCGLKYLSFDRTVKLRTRFYLLIDTVLWTISWAGPLVTIISFIFSEGYLPLWVGVPGAIVQGSYTAVYPPFRFELHHPSCKKEPWENNMNNSINQ